MNLVRTRNLLGLKSGLPFCVPTLLFDVCALQARLSECDGEIKILESSRDAVAKKVSDCEQDVKKLDQKYVGGMPENWRVEMGRGDLGLIS